jgi:hypothetical protein
MFKNSPAGCWLLAELRATVSWRQRLARITAFERVRPERFNRCPNKCLEEMYEE